MAHQRRRRAGTAGLLAHIDGRTARAVTQWLQGQPDSWKEQITHVSIDLSASYAKAVCDVLPDAVIVADKFHLVALGNQMLTEVRQHVTRTARGRRGRKRDPEWAARRWLLLGYERHTTQGFTRMWNALLDAGDPGLQVLHAFIVKEQLRRLLALPANADRELISHRLWQFNQLAADCEIPEVDRLAQTIEAWWPAVEAAIAIGYSNARSEGHNRPVDLMRYRFPFEELWTTPAQPTPTDQRERARTTVTAVAGITIAILAPTGVNRATSRSGGRVAPAPRRNPGHRLLGSSCRSPAIFVTTRAVKQFASTLAAMVCLAHRAGGAAHRPSWAPHVTVLAVMVLVLVSALSACTDDRSTPATATSSRTSDNLASAGDTVTGVVRDGTATTLSVAGIRVNLPEGSVKDDTRITLGTRQIPDTGLPPQVHPLGRMLAVDLPAPLSKHALVSFPAPASLSEQMIPVVFWQDGHGSWQIVPATWRPGQQMVTATVPHFSGGFLASIDVKAWAQKAKKDMAGYLTGRANVAQPHCGDEKAGRADGVEVASDLGDSVKWCFGIEKGQRVLKIANNRRTFTEVTFPKSWTVVNGTSISLSTNTVARALGTGIASLGAPDQQTRIVDAGGILTLALPPGQTGVATAQSSFAAWAVSAIVFGLEMYGQVAKVAGGAAANAAQSAHEKILNVLSGASDDDVIAALRTCTKGIGDLSDQPVDAASAAPILKFMWECIPPVMKTEFGHASLGWLAGAVLAVVGTVVGAILSAANLLITAGREIWDGFDSFAGNSDPIYDIAISASTVIDVSPYSKADFASPSGRIQCFLEQDQALCEFPMTMQGVSDLPTVRLGDSIDMPPLGVSVSRSNKWEFSTGKLTVPELASPYTAWFDDTDFAPAPGGAQGPLASLPYGHSLTYGDLRCDSKNTGMTCINTKTGNGFNVSDRGVTFTGNPPLDLGSAPLSAPAGLADAMSAQVPAYCQMPATSLVDGQSPAKYRPRQWMLDPNKAPPHLRIDMTGAGSKQLVVAIRCTAGGVGWPDVLLLLGRGGQLINSFKLDQLADTEHSTVTSLEAQGHSVAMTWSSYQGACFDNVDHTSRVTYSGGKLHVIEVRPPTRRDRCS